MTTGNVQSTWQKINGQSVLVLNRQNGEQVALTLDQINQILNPETKMQDGSSVFSLNIVDAVTPEQKQAIYGTTTPLITNNAFQLTAAEFDSICLTCKPLLEAQRTATQPTATVATAAMQPAQTNSDISLGGILTGGAATARLGANSVNKITTAGNQINRGITGFENADSISDYSRAMTNIANGTGRFAGLTNQGASLTTANASEDDRNFFLSAGNWLDRSLFGSIADMMPIDMLKKAVTMVGGCFSGLFKTVGYMVEGEWDKVGSIGLNWMKDVAITGALTYGAYYLGKELSLFGSSEDEKSTSSSSSSSSSGTNSNKVVQTTTTKETTITLSDRPSANSTPVATLDQAGKLITNGTDRYLDTGTILNEGTTSTVFEYVTTQKTDSK